MVSRSERSTPRDLFVIERANESSREWWTGTDWSEDYTKAKWYASEPNAANETEDEGARPVYYASGQIEPG